MQQIICPFCIVLFRDDDGFFSLVFFQHRLFSFLFSLHLSSRFLKIRFICHDSFMAFQQHFKTTRIYVIIPIGPLVTRPFCFLQQWNATHHVGVHHPDFFCPRPRISVMVLRMGGCNVLAQPAERLSFDNWSVSDNPPEFFGLSNNYNRHYHSHHHEVASMMTRKWWNVTLSLLLMCDKSAWYGPRYFSLAKDLG